MNQPENPIADGIISAFESQKRRPDRVNVFVDGAFSFAVDLSTLQDHGLAVGDQISPAQRASLQQDDEVSRALSAALALMASRPRSEREVRDRLVRRGFDSDVVSGVIGRLKERGYLNDEEFARFWIENRASFRPRGELALRQELRAKGVDRATVEQSLASAEIDDVALALDLARRKLGSLRDLDPETRRRRLTGLLQRRGFSYATIRKTVHQLELATEDSEVGGVD